MIKKLIKHDFIALNKTLFVLYGITLFLSVINIVSSYYGKSEIPRGIVIVSTDFALIFLFACLFFSIVSSYSRFRESMFKDEGYLTHTLPIKKGSLYDAKIITSLCTIFISLIVIGICFVYIFSHLSIFQFLTKILEQNNESYNIIYFFVDSIMTVFMIFLCLINGLIIGYKFDKRKDLMSFISAFLILVIIQFISVTILEFVNRELWDILEISIEFVFIFILYLTGRIMFSKGVNLE